MFKELTLQNIWESVMPVENDRRFKFKSAVWGPTLVEGLRSGQLELKGVGVDFQQVAFFGIF
jgi:hypothetical protein